MPGKIKPGTVQAKKGKQSEKDLLLAQVMGMYFMSSVLLMRMNMPEAYRKTISAVLGNIHFNFYHHWFDTVFILSALSTVGMLWVAQTLNAQRKADQGLGGGFP